MTAHDNVKFELDLKNERIADEALIADLQRVAGSRQSLLKLALRYQKKTPLRRGLFLWSVSASVRKNHECPRLYALAGRPRLNGAGQGWLTRILLARLSK